MLLLRVLLLGMALLVRVVRVARVTLLRVLLLRVALAGPVLRVLLVRLPVVAGLRGRVAARLLSAPSVAVPALCRLPVGRMRRAGPPATDRSLGPGHTQSSVP